MLTYNTQNKHINCLPCPKSPCPIWFLLTSLSLLQSLFLSFCYILAFLFYKHAKAVPDSAIQAWNVLPLGLWLTPSQYLGLSTKLNFSDTFLDCCRKKQHSHPHPPNITHFILFILLVSSLFICLVVCLAPLEFKSPEGRGFNLNTAQSWFLNTCWMGYILHKSETYLGI